jgi:hypothetical protein
VRQTNFVPFWSRDKAVTKALPTKPVIPVTKIFFINLPVSAVYTAFCYMLIKPISNKYIVQYLKYHIFFIFQVFN